MAFSVTFPASRAALPTFGPLTVGLGRAVVAAALAAACLRLTRARRPHRGQVARLVLVAAGVVVGFPLCSSLALTGTTAAHGAVLTGLLPMATAVAAVLRGGERPPRLFWVTAGLGVAAVLAFAAVQGAGRVQSTDGWLLLAVGFGGLGYAEGGALARELGGWQVIAWALLLALPVAVPAALIGWARHPPDDPHASAWIGLGYVSAVSMFAGFVAWYRGLAEGGVTGISQLQLAQPVLTMLWSALLLGEHPTAGTVATGLAVVAVVGLSQRVRRPAPSPAPAEKELGRVSGAPDVTGGRDGPEAGRRRTGHGRGVAVRRGGEDERQW